MSRDYCKGYVEGYRDAKRGRDYLIEIYRKSANYRYGYDSGYEDGVYNELPEIEVQSERDKSNGN